MTIPFDFETEVTVKVRAMGSFNHLGYPARTNCPNDEACPAEPPEMNWIALELEILNNRTTDIFHTLSEEQQERIREEALEAVTNG